MASVRLSRRALLQTLAPLASGVWGCGDYPGLPDTPGSRLYPARPSVFPGQTLTLHVSSAAPEFRLQLLRQGLSSELLLQSDWQPGVQVPGQRPDRAFDYPAYDIPLPATFPPGVYIARLLEGSGGVPLAVQSPSVLSGKAEALFVVRTPVQQARSILYKLPLATYHAYNFTGGGSLYHVAKHHHSGKPLFDLRQPRDASGGPGGTKVTLLRPGGGAGADTWHQEFDPYDPSSPRNTFAHWDAPFIAWLEQNGYAVDYCVDLDVHQQPDLLASYQLLLCAGHDEYWSEEQRVHTERYLQGGGNIGFFTGNTCWWRVRYVDADTSLLCDKHGAKPAPDQWYRNRPENTLTGVSYRHAGSWWRSRRTTLGYTVQHADHWVFANTALADGDVFGADDEQPLIGYECDGAPFTRAADGTAVATNDPSIGTPEHFLILGVAELGHEWPTKLGQGATMGTFSVAGGGTVFNAATIDWVKLLGRSAPVAQITRNVLDRLSSSS
jgi:hypothetical protein